MGYPGRAAMARASRLTFIACRELLAAGTYPSGDRLVLKVPGHCPQTLARIRDLLDAAGAIDLPPPPNGRRRGPAPRPANPPGEPGLVGCTPEERAEIRARYLEVRAAKIARGEPCGVVRWTVPVSRERPAH